MKKWSEIKQATLDKLFLDEQEAQQQGYLAKFQGFANECLNMISNGIKPRIATYEVTTTKENSVILMPDDFLSFADMIGYCDGVPDPTLIYIDDKRIIAPEAGNYVLFYNALWHDITRDDIVDDVELSIDYSVLNCLPTYIAAQCLGQDDIQRSAMLKNEFELLLARLDTNIMYESNHFKSNGGWY